MNKKILALLTSLLMVFVLMGCDSLGIGDENKDDTNTSTTDDGQANANNDNKTVVEKQCRLFYFNPTACDVYYVDKALQVTNDDLIGAINTELQSNTNNDLITMTKEVQVESAKVDPNTGILTVKFKNDFIGAMNLGDTPESGFYDALTKTYAYNYGVDMIAVYQNDKLYTGLRGDLPSGYNTISFEGVKPIGTEPKVEEKSCKVYYYNGDEDKIYYQETKIQVVDKAAVTALTKAIKNVPSDKYFKINDDIGVTSAKLDSEAGILTVNLTENYYDMMSSVGSGSEAGILKSLAYTYGDYYGVDKVIIQVGGKNYAGSHITYADGESIKIDTTQAAAIN